MGNRDRVNRVRVPDYEASVGASIKMLQGHWGHEMSAPAKVVQVVLQLAERATHCTPLARQRCRAVCAPGRGKAETDAKVWHNISVSTDVEDVRGLPDFKF